MRQCMAQLISVPLYSGSVSTASYSSARSGHLATDHIEMSLIGVHNAVDAVATGHGEQ